MAVLSRRALIALISVLSIAPLIRTAHAADDPPGKAVYDKVCRVCHGPDGSGNQGPRLIPFELDDDELLIRVREGGGEMPPISENRVSDDQVKQIAAYLRSLSAQ